MTAVTDLITILQQNDLSTGLQPLTATVEGMVAAMLELQSGVSPLVTAQSANRILAGPTAGAPALPTFRSLVANDIPAVLNATAFAAGTPAAPGVAFNTNYGFLYDPANFLQASSTAVVCSIAGQMDFTFGRSSTGSSNLYVTSDTASANNTVWGFAAGATTPLGQFNIRRSHGGYAAPTFPVQNDFIGDMRWQISNLTNTVNGIALRGVVIDPTPSATAAGSRLIGLVSPIGSVTLTEIFRYDQATGYSMFGSNVIIDQNRLHVFRAFTVATLPTGVQPYSRAFVTDALVALSGVTLGTAIAAGGANKVPVYTTDGTNWLYG